MTVIYVVEQHDQVLSLWQAQQASALRVLHLDFHCDLRGLLIDRSAQRAYRIWDRFQAVDEGNFLTHAIEEGRVRGIRWVHDEPGGRKYDLGTVKYESDLSVQPYRWLLTLRGTGGYPLAYEVLPYQNWLGINEGECLDIDWDFFACTAYPAETIQNRVNAFLAREFPVVPDHVYLCYSPNYSHPTRPQFQQFVKDLAQIFRAEVVQVPLSLTSSISKPAYKSSPWYRYVRQVYRTAQLGLRKRGVY